MIRASNSRGSMVAKCAIRDDGAALVLALMALLFLSAIAFALLAITSTETAIAGNYQSAIEGLYAADAALERATRDLSTAPDWNPFINGSVQSSFTDGPPGGTRRLADGSTLDLAQVRSMANCGKTTPCAAPDLTRDLNGDRPWGANNPVWELYAYGPIDHLLPGDAIKSQFYVVVMVADDPSENDDDPAHDGSAPCPPDPPEMLSDVAVPCNPGSGVMAVRAEAFGPRGAHKIIELTIARPDPAETKTVETGLRTISWREVR